ncbi:MAG TPA: M48 family metalloprotease [Gaiellaceae bacterium]|nr:M48 family metalloprotease [Gaiellaceae bacterium]
MSRRLPLLAVLAAAWAVAVWLLWRSSLPAYHLPPLDPRTLFSPQVLHRADDYSDGARLLWLGNVVAELVVLGVYAIYGIRFARESAAGPIGTGMLLGMLGFGLVWAAQLPVAVLSVWWRHRYGLDGSYVQATIGNWLALAGAFLFLSFALAIVMGLARRIGRWWWLAAAPFFIGLAILFAFVTPWLLGGRAYHAPYVQRLERVEHVQHVPVRVLDGFDEPNAFATGLGVSRRVFLWRPIVVPPFTPRMDEFVLAHELGHLAHNHIWKSLAWYALFAFPGAYLIALATRRRGGMGVPEAVPLAIFVLVVLQLLQLPLQNVISRHLEAEADWSALRATHDPAAGRRLFELFGSETLEDPSPPWWDYVLLENHPTLLQRIEMTQYYRTYAAAQSP